MKSFIKIFIIFIFILQNNWHFALASGINPTSAEDYPAISQMEIEIFNKEFTEENIYSRLNRLESKVLEQFSRQMIYTTELKG
ncbi:MAG: hypothetical protein MZV70_69990 [Desulfobacterales bacterium]|nr:hypothetical protein [Desulfobacterales bacterium]